MKKPLAGLLLFLAALIRELLPFLFSEARKPRETKPVGGGKETRDAVNDCIEEQLK